MLLEEILSPDAVLCNAQARSKKHCLEILSELLVRSHPEIPHEDIVELLIERERLGCTGLGRGVAFPHCRVAAISNPVAALIRLSKPVDFDASDGLPVDLVFGMMVPDPLDDSHRAAIGGVTGMFEADALRERLRDARSSSDLYDRIVAGRDAPSQRVAGSGAT